MNALRVRVGQISLALSSACREMLIAASAASISLIALRGALLLMRYCKCSALILLFQVRQRPLILAARACAMAVSLIAAVKLQEQTSDRTPGTQVITVIPYSRVSMRTDVIA